MCRNFETYCTFNSKLNIPITLENLKQKQETFFWTKCTNELTINSILDLFNHIFSNSKDENYLSEEYFINIGLQSYFLHTSGKNTLLNGLKLGLNKFSDTDRITIRIISPYITALSLETFTSYFFNCLKRPFKLEILTNYLPDFQNYYDSSGFIDPDQYENLKLEYKKINNIDIEMRFWSVEGLEDIPGNFIHSKLYFISSNTDSKHVFILSSANFSKTAWGLEEVKNLEIGYIEVQQHNSKKIYDFFNEFWGMSLTDEQQYLNQIAKVRKKIVNKELISEVPFKEFFSKPKSKKRLIKSSGIKHGSEFQRLLKIEVPQDEHLEKFLKGSIKINFKEHSPEINTIQAEIHLLDITNQSSKTLDYSFDVSEKNAYSLSLENVKMDLQLNQNIDSIIIRANTNISSNDIQIKTNSWEKIKSENIGDYSNKEIRLYNFSKYKSFNTTQINAFLIADKVFKINSCEIDNTDIVIPIPKNVTIEQIKSIIIRQTQQDYYFKTILFYQPHLIFEKEPIKKITTHQEVIGGIEIQMLQIKASKKWLELDHSDFVFRFNGDNIIPLCVSKENCIDYSIFSFTFNSEFEKLHISLNPIFKRFFKKIDKQFSYLNQPSHKKGIDKLTKSYTSNMVDLNVMPNDPNETTPIKMYIKNRYNGTFGIEYTIKDGRLNTYKRPNVLNFQKFEIEYNLGILKPGQILGYRPFIKIGIFRFYTQEYKELVIKNRLIDDINIELPFDTHKRILSYSKISGNKVLFSIKLKFNTKYNDLVKNISDATVIMDDDIYNLIRIKSKTNLNSFYIFFKMNSFSEEKGVKKISLYINTDESFSDFNKDIEIYYRKTNDGIFIKVGDVEKFIEDGNKQIIEDYFMEVLFPLSEKNIINKPSKMVFKKYENESILDSSELILPVWFEE